MNVVHKNHCIICNGKGEGIDKLTSIFSWLRLLLCKGCGLIFPSKKYELAELVVLHHKSYRKSVDSNFFPRKGSIRKYAKNSITRFNRMRNFIKKDAVVLDSNAHTGELMFLLRRFGIFVEGIESNPYYLTYAAHEFGIQLNNIFLDNIETKMSYYDFIFSYQMLDKYQDPLYILKVFRNSLKDNGYLHIVLENCEYDTVSGLRQYGLNIYTASCLFKIAGFKILNVVLVPEK